jgi:predicted metal-dependent phosphotriesterase family hydrolase
VLGTDFGQASNIHPVLAMQEYIQRLQEAGFKDKEIETMAVKNPKTLLGFDRESQ